MSAEEGRQTFITSDGREIRRPKRRARIPERYQALIDGKLSIEDLDEEELFRGQLRNADGYIRGVPPNAIPWVMHKAYVDQVGKTLERTIIQSMPDIVQALIDIATGGGDGYDTGVAMDVRAKAAMYLTDRILGRPTERREMDVQVHARWEQAFEGGSLVVDLDDPDIIDVEPVETPALPQASVLVEREPGGREDEVEPPNTSQPRPARRKTGVKLK